jgi:2-methylaconitate cis-trans-isomerase PrpF
MRGGTSKCWVFRVTDLPADRAERDALLLRVFGSPDPRQVDGVGGATSTTSKALVVDGYSEATGCVEYRFAQVSVDRTRVEWDSNCGNCATSLGLYAAQEVLVSPTLGLTTVPLLNTATGLRLDAEIDTPDGRAPRDGETYITGAVYPGARVSLRCGPSSWATYGRTLPTGNAQDLLTVGGRQLRVTMIDAGAPAVLVHADDLGLTAMSTSTAEIDRWLPLLVEVRQAAAALMGISNGGSQLQSIPKVGIVGPPRAEGGTDLEARMVSMTAAHPSIGITSSIAVSAASSVPGTTVAEVMSRSADHALRIGTIAGCVEMGIDTLASGEVQAVSCVRSARRIADATLHVPAGWADLVLAGGASTTKETATP